MFVEWYTKNLPFMAQELAACNDPDAIREVLFTIKQAFESEWEQRSRMAERVDALRVQLNSLNKK